MKETKFRYIENRKAKHNYYFIDEYTAGISLIGSEVKSIRASWVDLSESYCMFNKSGELILKNCYIYKYNNIIYTREENIDRKLLLTKKELKKLVAKLSDKLAEIYYLMPDEFNILILGSEYSEKIEQWFMKLVKFFTYKMLPELSDCENEVLSSAFSVSIVKGISRIMYRNNLTIDELKRVLIIYINNYIDGFVEKR